MQFILFLFWTILSNFYAAEQFFTSHLSVFNAKIEQSIQNYAKQKDVHKKSLRI